jgi:hypothetical protein
MLLLLFTSIHHEVIFKQLKQLSMGTTDVSERSWKQINTCISKRGNFLSIKIRFSIYFKAYFLTIFAYNSVSSAQGHLCKNFECYVFRLLNLSGVPLSKYTNEQL